MVLKIMLTNASLHKIILKYILKTLCLQPRVFEISAIQMSATLLVVLRHSEEIYVQKFCVAFTHLD